MNIEPVTELDERFAEYLNEWDDLQQGFRNIHWVWRTVFYFPIGFVLEWRLLNKMSRLTQEYTDYLVEIRSV